MLIDLHRDALHIHSRCRRVLVIQRLLGILVAAGFFRHDPRVGMTSLVDMNVSDARFFCIRLQVARKRARGERCSRLTGAVTPCLQRGY